MNLFIWRQRKIHDSSLPGGTPCSNTGERGWRKETSGGDPSSGGDPEWAASTVGVLLSGGLPSAEGQRACLAPLLSSIDCNWGARKVNAKRKGKRECEMVISARRRRYLYPVKHRIVIVKGIILRVVHHVSVIQTVKQNVWLFREMYTETWQPCSCRHVYCGLINVYRTHHQHSASSGKDYQKIEGIMKSIRESQCMKSGLTEVSDQWVSIDR
jgi:hypothetical protein